MPDSPQLLQTNLLQYSSLTEAVQMEAYDIVGRDAASIIRSVEQGVASGALRPEQTVPSVRALARHLGLSPTTVSSAYRDLRQRGVLVSHDRSRTVVAHRPPLAVRLSPELPPGAMDLTDGSPAVTLLPDLAPALARADTTQRLYTEGVALAELSALARRSFHDDRVACEHLAVVGGALDGIERVLQVHTAVGDAIAVEDPGYAASLDLVRTLGLRPEPVAIDEQGPRPSSLEAALDAGVRAVLLVPRAQNPTGAALSQERAEQLGTLLAEHPEVLVIEDDHAGPVAGAPYRSVVSTQGHWAVVRSLSKSLGPDLRVAVLAGDAHTVTRVLGRQRVGTGWVSRLLQSIAAITWERAERDGTVAHAAQEYTRRREALIEALAARGLAAAGASGLNVWVPVSEEAPVVQAMAARGWGLQPGQPYRIVSPPAVRVTVARLEPDAAERLADDLGDVLEQRLPSRRG